MLGAALSCAAGCDWQFICLVIRRYGRDTSHPSPASSQGSSEGGGWKGGGGNSSHTLRGSHLEGEGPPAPRPGEKIVHVSQAADRLWADTSNSHGRSLASAGKPDASMLCESYNCLKSDIKLASYVP